MMTLRDLLILNLTLQVFDGLFSYQAFSLGAAEANPLRFRCNRELGCDLRIALQENFGLCTVVVDICVQAQPAIAYQARIDGHGVRVCLCHGCLSVENSKLVITIVDTATSSGKTIETVKYHPPTLSAMWPILENNYSNATGVYSRHKVAEREPSPLDNETRRMIGEKVFAAYQPFAEEPVKRRL